MCIRDRCTTAGAELDKEADREKQISAQKRDVFWATIKDDVEETRDPKTLHVVQGIPRDSR